MNPANDLKGQAIPLAESIDYAEGSIVSRTLLDRENGTLTLFAFDRGQRLSEHTSPYDATILVLEGVGALTLGGKPLRADAGTLTILPANVPHDVQAEDRFKMLLIMIR